MAITPQQQAEYNRLTDLVTRYNSSLNNSNITGTDREGVIRARDNALAQIDALRRSEQIQVTTPASNSQNPPVESTIVTIGSGLFGGTTMTETNSKGTTVTVDTSADIKLPATPTTPYQVSPIIILKENPLGYDTVEKYGTDFVISC